MSTPNNQSPLYISLQRAAERTDFSIHKMRELVASGALPAYRLSDKPGSAIRVKVADVDALMKPVVPAAILASR
ncbi:MAG: DNA-binding protein [Mycobacterium sp.]|nr:MAG: DNA-binding protein [Mycobacterium sp.]